ncbi:MAG: hypothetical protein J2P21_03675 [Chloracidobacterium sp.]|nr:hypothetical protein [Chloracidobacterium sp.]
MLRFTRFSILSSTALLFIFSIDSAQTPQRDNRPRTASISGRVTVGGAPAANALVTVAEVDSRSKTSWPASSNSESQQRAYIKVRTDGDGRYQVAGLTEGAYMIRALSRAYTATKTTPDFGVSRSVTLDEGEARDGVDIALVRGGVITGRVTDAEDGPLIGARLQLQFVDERGIPRWGGGNQPNGQTDDRGVYRIYGLPAGRYILSAAAIFDGSAFPNHRLPQTFYPDVTDQKQAKIIEVKESAEVAGIDIRFGAAADTYEAAGRVIDAETGRPLPGVWVGCMEAPDNKNGVSGYGSGAQTDDEGKFRVIGLSSGRYELDLQSQQTDGEHYSEKTLFEVDDSDVSGIEVKAIRVSTLSGVVVIEGPGDPSVKAKLSQVSVMVQTTRRLESGGDGRDYGSSAQAKIAGDGGFRITGVAPGMATFSFGNSQDTAFLIKRVERDGLEVRNAFDIGRGEQVTGVRIVAVQANGSIRGQVEIAGGRLPEGWNLSVYAAPGEIAPSNEGIPAFYTNNNSGFATPDEKGRFVIERLAPGEYELRLNVTMRVRPGELWAVGGLDQIKQHVTVLSGVETPAKLTLDLSRKQ